MLGLPRVDFDITDRDEFKKAVKAAKRFKEWFYSTTKDQGAYIDNVCDDSWQDIKFLPWVDLSYKESLAGDMIRGLTNLRVFPDYWDWTLVKGEGWMCAYLEQITKVNVDLSNVTFLNGSTFRGASALKSAVITGLNKASKVTWTFSGDRLLEDAYIYGLDNVDDIMGTFEYCDSLKTAVLEGKWNQDTIQMHEMFHGNASTCDNITFVGLDTKQHLLDCGYMFLESGISDLDNIKGVTWNVRNGHFMFQNCPNLTHIGDIIFNNDEYWYSIIQCPKLQSVGNIVYTDACSYADIIFYADPLLERIESITMGKGLYRAVTILHSGLNSLKYCVVFGLGQHASQTNVRLYAANWGADSDVNRQSLVDSIVINSFDRATAGYSACSVTMASASVARLTDDEKAQATAKGYTLVSA